MTAEMRQARMSGTPLDGGKPVRCVHPSDATAAGEHQGDSLTAGASGERPEPDSGTTATGSAMGRSSKARPPHARAKPCPQQPPLADSGSAQTLLAPETTEEGSVAPEESRRAFARMQGGVTVGKPQDTPAASSASSA